MKLAVKIIPLTAGTADLAGDAEIVPCPVDVEPDTVLSFIKQRFGEPIETAWTPTDKHSRIAAGWIFPSRSLTEEGQVIEFLCVPLAEDADGSWQPMFELQADLRQEFDNAAQSGLLDAYTVADQEQRDRPTSAANHSAADSKETQ